MPATEALIRHYQEVARLLVAPCDGTVNRAYFPPGGSGVGYTSPCGTENILCPPCWTRAHRDGELPGDPAPWVDPTSWLSANAK